MKKEVFEIPGNAKQRYAVPFQEGIIVFFGTQRKARQCRATHGIAKQRYAPTHQGGLDGYLFGITFFF